MSGFTRVTWRKEAKPEPTSSTATRTPSSAQAVQRGGQLHVVLDGLVLRDLDHERAAGAGGAIAYARSSCSCTAGETFSAR